VRGVLKSKPLNEIIQEAEGLIKNGFKEIVLCGICLGAYGRDLPERMSLEDVIGALEKIQGLWRLRLSSIEASDISKGLLKKLAESQKLCRHLHIPLQSGDDEILRNMNRKFNRQDYIDLINKIKSRIPKIAITTDVMVGFPGEDEFHFQNTLNLIKEILPLKVHIFPYSPRRGTVAYNFKDKVDALKIKERIVHLESLSEACALTYKKQFLNKNMDVLIEQRCRENKAYWEGYTDNYIKVRVKSDRDLRNQLVSLRLKKTLKDFMLGTHPKEPSLNSPTYLFP
jgi:threonylcarbamoyladenosine tRNA methylthiotransferase MtaB